MAEQMLDAAALRELLPKNGRAAAKREAVAHLRAVLGQDHVALLSIITTGLSYAHLAAALEDSIAQRLAQLIRQVDAERVFPRDCVPCPDHLHPMKGE